MTKNDSAAVEQALPPRTNQPQGSKEKQTATNPDRSMARWDHSFDSQLSMIS
jgi:hypothetical protein